MAKISESAVWRKASRRLWRLVKYRENSRSFAQYGPYALRGVCLGGMVPRFMVQVMRALGGAKALFLDHLHPGPTSYAAAYQDEESFSVAHRLFRHWQSRLPQLGPGDEYALVDEFGDILGLRGWFEWRTDPGAVK